MATPTYVSIAEIEFWLQGWDKSMVLPTSGTGLAYTNEAIVGVEKEVEDVLGANGYVIPVTDADTISLLKRYLVPELAFTFYTRLHVDAEIPATVQMWHNKFSNWLDRIRNQTQNSRVLRRGTLVWYNYPDDEFEG